MSSRTASPGPRLVGRLDSKVFSENSGGNKVNAQLIVQTAITRRRSIASLVKSILLLSNDDLERHGLNALECDLN